MNNKRWPQYDVIYRQPALTGLVAQVRGGWTRAEREAWMEALARVLDFVAPVAEQAPSEGDTE